MQSKAKTSHFVILIAANAAFAGLIFGYDVAVMNGALVFLRSTFSLSPFETEMVTSVLFWGCAMGAVLGGLTSDRLGRRKALFGAAALFFAADVGGAISISFSQLIVARLLAGIAVGAALLVAPLYIAEISPAHSRGRLVTVNQLAMVSGILIGFLCNYILVRGMGGNWRWMFGTGSLPAAALCVSLLWIPESPRWLVQHGQRKLAQTVLQRFSSAATLETELSVISKAISEENGTYRELIGRSLRRPLLLAIMLAIIQQVTGVNTVLYFGAILFAEQAGAGSVQAIGMNVLVGIVNLVFTIVGLLLIDRLGRRPLLLIGTGGMGLSLLIFAWMLRVVHGQPLLTLLPVLAYVAFFAFGLGTGVWVCLAELFPNYIRGRAMAIATMVLWVSVSFVSGTFLSLINRFSASVVFLGYAVLCGASFAYILFQLPETKNRTLEEIAIGWKKQNEGKIASLDVSEATKSRGSAGEYLPRNGMRSKG